MADSSDWLWSKRAGWRGRTPGPPTRFSRAELLGVSSTEFPTLKQAPQTLGAALIKRAEPDYLTKKADAAATAFIADLSKGGL